MSKDTNNVATTCPRTQAIFSKNLPNGACYVAKTCPKTQGHTSYLAKTCPKDRNNLANTCPKTQAIQQKLEYLKLQDQLRARENAFTVKKRSSLLKDWLSQPK